MGVKHSINCLLASAVMAGGVAFAGSAAAGPQGLYSVDELMDADVYLNGDAEKEIGEVEDILLNDEMGLQALVIQIGGFLDMGGKEVVVKRGAFTVSTEKGQSLHEVEYDVHIDMTEEELEALPEYTDDWWKRATNAAAKAWKHTTEAASSAWESTKSATSDVLTEVGNALESAGQRMDDGN